MLPLGGSGMDAFSMGGSDVCLCLQEKSLISEFQGCLCLVPYGLSIKLYQLLFAALWSIPFLLCHKYSVTFSLPGVDPCLRTHQSYELEPEVGTEPLVSMCTHVWVCLCLCICISQINSLFSHGSPGNVEPHI